MQVARLPKMLKPVAGGQELCPLGGADGAATSRTPPGLPGWLGTARTDRWIRNLGDPVPWVEPRDLRDVITAGLGHRTSEGLIVVSKRGNSRGAKGLCQSHVDARGSRSRLGRKRPVTEEERREATQLGWEEWRRVPPKLADLRLKLFLKAKREQKFRCDVLYDRIFRKDVLRTAWELVRANRGAPGVDGVTVDQIAHAEGGPEALVEQLHHEL